MPQPAANAAAAQRLIDIYRESQDSLEQRIAVDLADPAKLTEARRLRGLLRDVNAQIDQLQQEVHDWLEAEVPPLWEAGGATFADEAGTTFAWSSSHLEAVQAFAETQWSDVLANTNAMRADTLDIIRGLARTAARRGITEGVTAKQAGRDLAQQVTEQTGLLTITYANGAEHSVADWGDMSARTSTALAYNRGTIQQARDDHFDRLLIVDGDGCGWTTHDDPDLADGSVRTLDDFDEYPISHPRCARSASPYIEAAA